MQRLGDNNKVLLLHRNVRFSIGSYMQKKTKIAQAYCKKDGLIQTMDDVFVKIQVLLVPTPGGNISNIPLVSVTKIDHENTLCFPL